MLTRRRFSGLLGSSAVLATTSGPVGAQDASAAELAKPGPLGDVWLGSSDARVTVIEYASLTCTHCAHFHATTLPELKKRYVDPGQVRFTLREFPLDPLATAGFMLARADDGARYYPITDLLFDKQRSWAFADKPLDALLQIMRQAGFSKERFEAVLRDQRLYDAVNAVKNRAVDAFKVDSTPTFFVNGKRIPGAVAMDELDRTIKPLLGA